MSTQEIKLFSFAEILPDRHSSVRIIDERFFVAVDLVVVVTGKNRDDAARVLRDLPEDKFAESNYQILSLPGKGNSKVKTLDLTNSINLIMVMPGKLAKEFRQRFSTIVKRFMAGDRTLIQEIDANASSSHPLAQMARASLPSAGSSAASGNKSIAGTSGKCTIDPSAFYFGKRISTSSGEASAPMPKSSIDPSAFDHSKPVAGPSGGAPSAPVMGAVFESIPPSIGQSSKVILGPIPPYSQDSAIEREQLTAYRAKLQQAHDYATRINTQLKQYKGELGSRVTEFNGRKAELDARTAANNTRSAGLDARSMALDCKKVELDARDAKLDKAKAGLDARAVELDKAKAGLDARAVELDKAKARLDTRAVELDRKEFELDARDAQFVRRTTELQEMEARLDARKDDLDEREGQFERSEDNADRRTVAQDKRDVELDRREAQLKERQASVLHALGVESDKNHAELGRKKAELDARAAELDKAKAELDARAAELDKAKVELDKAKTELDARAAELGAPQDKHNLVEVVVAEEVQPGRKRQREVDFSLVTQMGAELEKILAMTLDDETKQELKQRLYAMLRAD